jgi:transcriptional regulator with XRE-family HTH domain
MVGGMDFDRIAQDLLVALRGHRSQVAWSRRLGYRSNVAYAWESGNRSPTAAEALRAAGRAGVDLPAALTRFYGRRPPWLDELDPASPAAVARLLDDLRGSASITDLARRSGQSRYSLSRWLGGQTQPRLADFLCLVEAASVRLVDLLAVLVDPATLPSMAALWARVEARRRGAHELPWTQAVLRALELDTYRALPAHVPGWIAGRLGLPREEEDRCLAFLAETGQITWKQDHYQVEALAVDTRRQPDVGQRLKAHWTRVAADRIDRSAGGQFSYNVFTVSDADFERIRALHLAYFDALRAIVAESQPGERVAVANVQLFALDAGPGGPPTPPITPPVTPPPAPPAARRDR